MSSIDGHVLEAVSLLDAGIQGKRDQGPSLFFCPDRRFMRPTGTAMFMLENMDHVSADDYVRHAIYTGMVRESLNEEAYDASLGGLGYELSNSTRGLSIGVGGYTERMETFLSQMLLRVKDPGNLCDVGLFGRLVDNSLRGLRSLEMEYPPPLILILKWEAFVA